MVAQHAPHDVLAECLERWESGQGGVDEFLAQHPEVREELEPLLGVAVKLWALPRVNAPARLRQDPLWRRAAAQTAPPATVTAPDLLTRCLDRAAERAEVDALLARHPELRDDVEPLLALAAELSAMPRVRAPARLRQDPLWRRGHAPVARPAPTPLPLWAAAREDRRARGAPFARPSEGLTRRLSGSLGRIAAGVGGAGLALLFAGSLATSTATSLPDEPLYPVKRLVEDAQLAIAPPEARLELRLQRAQERMKETREMIERERADVVASLAADYVREVDAVRTELQAPRARTPEPEQVGRVITRLEANEQMLGAIVDRVPAPARPAVARAAEASRPESVAPIEVPVQRAAAPAAPAPEAVVPPAPAPEAVTAPAPAAPASSAAPVFGAPASPGSVAAPEPASPVQRALDAARTSEPARLAPPRVSVPSGSAPALLPNASTRAPAATNPAPVTSAAPASNASPTAAPSPTETTSGATQAAAPTSAPALAAPSPTPQAPAQPSPTTGTAAPASTSASSAGYTLLPPVGPSPTPTANTTRAAP